MSTRLKKGMSCLAASLTLLLCSAQAGSATYDFSADPTTDPNIQFASTLTTAGYPNWLNTGGNPGGFLVLSYAGTYQNTHMIFPDLDPGKVVTAFTFECDLRLGNGTAQPADGFSINFARSYDPVIEQWNLGLPGRGYAGETLGGFPGGEAASIPETGTATGIAICFDTWSGNALPDGTDLVGIMVRVDNKTLPGPSNARGFPLPTFNGACADATSAQTGPRDEDFWAAGGDIYSPEAWDTLCWAHLRVVLTEDAKLTVIWKGTTLLDNYQTEYFPTPGRLIFGGRTGGSHEQTHVDNIVLTTTATILDNDPPSTPGNLRTTLVGARRVALAWDASVDAPDPAGRVAYNVYRDGTLIGNAITATTYTDAPGADQTAANQLAPGSAHNYEVKAIDLSQNESVAATLAVTTAAEVAVPGYFKGQLYTDVTGTTVANSKTYDTWPYTDANYPASPGKEAWWLSGLSFGDNTAFGGTLGDNYGFRFAGTVTAPKTGQYRFFIRSDDASSFWLNTAGAALPNVDNEFPIAEELDCCDNFLEPGVGNDSPNEDTFATSDPIPLTAGQKYGFIWLVKEGGGGDWGRVGWRMEGDTTPAANLPPISGAFIEPATGGSMSDPGGASAVITTNLVDVSAGANAHLTLTVGATTASPWGYPAKYQWFKDGSAIMNANAASYYVDVLAPADAGVYKVQVSVPGAYVDSANMTLTVTNDLTKPTIDVSNVHGTADLTHVRVRFSEPVVNGATTASNYTMEPALAVSAATRIDTYTIELTTAAQAPGAKYTLTVNNVADNAGNVIEPNSTVEWKAYVVVGVAGPVTFEIYDGVAGANAGAITGTTVAELLAYAGYPASPDSTVTITAWNTRLHYANDAHENYGARLTGLITPTESGNYRFFIYSDDSSQLWLSTDTTEANLVKIAEETGCCEAFREPPSEQVSAPIALVGGTSYLLRGIYKEGGGGDYMQVAWRKEGSGVPAAGLTPIPGTFDPWAGAPIITVQPMGAAVAAGASATMSVVVDLGQRPISYQWQVLGPRTTWTNIEGATGSTLTIENVDLSKITAYRVVATNPVGNVASRGVALTLANSYVIEAEDFDFGGGQRQTAADTMPYTGFAYDGLSAIYNVDYHNDNNDSITYRRGGDLGVGGQGASMDNATGNLLSINRGSWDMVNNYKIGWIGGGDWHNYTRAIPAGTYTAFAALSYGDTAANALNAKLSRVTAGVGTTNQTLVDLGTFLQDGSGAWGQNNLVPMKDGGGATATFSVADPLTTLRMSHNSGDFDWFMLVPAGGVTQPEITKIERNTNGSITIEWTGGGALEAAASLSGPWQTVTDVSPYTFTPEAGVPALFGRIKK